MNAPHAILANDALVGIGIGVSGGGTHLGRAIVLALAAAGAEVVAFGRRREPLEEAALEALGLTGNVHVEVADQHRDEDLMRVLDRLDKEAGCVRGWVNNACGVEPSLLGSLERERVDNTVESTLSDVIMATEQAADRMTGQGGAIVNIASMYGLVSPQPSLYDAHPQFHNPPAYGAAKAGVIEFTRYAACHFAEAGIRVNCVNFVYADTDSTRFFTGEGHDEMVRDVKALTPLRGLATADDVADAIAYLCSPQSRFVNGQTIMVDGGILLTAPAPEHLPPID